MALTKKQKLGLAVAATVGVGLAVAVASASPKRKRKPSDDELEDEPLDDELPDDDDDGDLDDELPELPELPDEDDVDDVLEDADDVLEDFPIPDEVRERLPKKKPKKPKKKPKEPPRKEPPPVVDVAPPEVEIPDEPGVVEAPDVIQAPRPNAGEVTLAMVEALLNAEGAPNWKGRHKDVVQAFQAQEGIKIDGLYGPGTSLRTAMKVPTVPIVRYWPKASGVNPQAAVDSYRDGLLEIAKQASGVRAQLLRASAARETGQGFGPPQGSDGKAPVSPTFQLGGASGSFGTA